MIEVRLYIQSAEVAYEVPLNGDRLTIGRGDAVTHTINDSGLSRQHASIYRQAEIVWIVDENSTNGSFVNERQVEPTGTRLHDGDLISIGDHTTITVKLNNPAPQRVSQHVLANIVQQSAAQARPTKSHTGSSFGMWPLIAAGAALVIIVLAVVGIITTRALKSKDAESSQEVMAQPDQTSTAEDGAGDEYVEDEVDVPEALATVEESAGAETSGTTETSTSTETPRVDKAADIAVLRQALLRMIEDRKEPVATQAKVEVPAELKHYSERGRFLAVQTAAALQQNLRIPHDFAELITLIQAKQLVELKPLGDNYVLYGVGSVSDEPFTHYDKATGKSVPLYKTAADLQSALKAMPENDERKNLIASFYQDKKNFQLAASEYEKIAEVARDFDGKSYNLNDANSRRQLKQRLLSFIRPAARGIMEELALSYKQKFNRPLPIASVIRTEQYQVELSKRNANAARNALPPHTTGLAFDISYRYMAAGEQNFLMTEIARMEMAGRVEALRENNNCLHVFAFLDGRRPLESNIKKAMGG
jgi:pSer/pThr/pTyr-binding forkhead associated (FHA) protein